ncbi:MAG TPA: MMPL family transporter, partial [Terriglobales bacterium]|nr:MMPL family transporter [Terriglobales bacterium]
RSRAILRAPFDLQGARLVRRDPLGLIPLAASSFEDAAGASSFASTGHIASADGKALLVLARPQASAFDIQFTKQLLADVRRSVAIVEERLQEHGVRVGYTGSYAFALEDEATIRADIRRYVVLALAVVLVIFYAGYRNLRILPFVTWPLMLSTLTSFSASLVFFDSLNAVSTSFAAILYGLSIDSAVHYYTRLLQERRELPLQQAVARTLSRMGGANLVASATTAAVFAIIGASSLRGIAQLGDLTAFGMAVNIMQFFVLYPALSFAMPGTATLPYAGETPRLGAIAEWCSRHARTVLFAGAVIAVVAAVGASRVGFDSNLLSLRPSGSPAAEIHDRITAKFGASAGAGAVLVRAADIEKALQRAENVERQLRRYLAEGKLESVRAVSAMLPSQRTQRQRLARFEELRPSQRIGDIRAAMTAAGFVPDQFEELFTRLAASPRPLVQYGDPALAPFSAPIARMVRPGTDGFTVGVFLEPAAGVRLSEIERDLRRDVTEIEMVVTGRGLLEEELERLLRREVLWFFFGSFVLNLAIIFAQLRRLGLSLALLGVPTLVVVICIALMRWIGGGIGPANLIVVPLLIGIGVDYSVYFAERYFETSSPGEAARLGGRALSISALTTMAGFGFLGLSNYPALADLGTLSAFGLLLCLIGSVTLAPALLSLTRRL